MILFLSISDWANQGKTMAKAVNAAGGDAVHMSMMPLIFNDMRGECIPTSMYSLRGVIEMADVIVFMHSNPHFVKLPINTGKAKLAVFHGGSQYRNNPDMMNLVFNNVVETSLIQTPDLLDLGAKNEKFISNGVDIKSILEIANGYESDGDEITIGYFPSNPSTKGFQTVVPVINKIRQIHRDKVKLITSSAQNPWEVTIRFMAKCDIIVDAIQPAIGTKMYGEWGVQTLEAAAMGKVVFTHFYHEGAYREFIGGHSLCVTNSGVELFDKLNQMITSSTKSKIQKRGRTTAGWCHRQHGLKPFGRRILEALEVTPWQD